MNRSKDITSSKTEHACDTKPMPIEDRLALIETRISELAAEIEHHSKVLDRVIKCARNSAEIAQEGYRINKSDIYALADLVDLIIEKVFPENKKYQAAIDKILKTDHRKGK